MIGRTLALASLAAWGKLVFAHGRFWLSGPRLRAKAMAQRAWPDVAVVVPARDEAESIQACVASLVGQDYLGKLSVIVVDDNSSDGTGDLARAVEDPQGRLTVMTGAVRPDGWSGKLWAVHQGERHALRRIDGKGYLFLTDADILHDVGHLRTLVAKAQDDDLDLVSEMVELNCESAAERLLVPAFVYFFAMLYPFAKINDPTSSVAGAAGGTILVRRQALEKIGGIESVRGALIDDCTLAARVKKTGGKLFLGHSTLARSVRPYCGASDIWRMVSRTAYVQLRYSPMLLAMTILGMLVVWIAPVMFTIFGRGRLRRLGLLSSILCAVSFWPTIQRFRLSPLRILQLPLAAAFYMAATVGSAFDHHRGRGARWKNRAYTEEIHAS